jgi:hypothetical protein
MDSDGESGAGTETSVSPLAGKFKGQRYREIRHIVPDGPECLPLPSEASDDDAIETEDDESTEAFSQTTEGTEDDEEEEEEWVPPVIQTPKSRASRAKSSRFSSVSSADHSSVPPNKTRASKGRVTKLQKEMEQLSLGGTDSDSGLSGYLLPTRKTRRVTVVDEESGSEDELATIKKKKMYVPRA